MVSSSWFSRGFTRAASTVDAGAGPDGARGSFEFSISISSFSSSSSTSLSGAMSSIGMSPSDMSLTSSRIGGSSSSSSSSLGGPRFRVGSGGDAAYPLFGAAVGPGGERSGGGLLGVTDLRGGWCRLGGERVPDRLSLVGDLGRGIV